MVVDNIKLAPHGVVHPTLNILGQEITIDLPLPSLILASVGALFLLRQAFCIFRLILEIFILPGTPIKSFQDLRGKKTWAIVTGATAGIGAEFSRQLAAKGFNVILVGRRQAATQEVADEIANKYKVETKVLTIDVANPESRATGCREIERLTQAVDIGVLVNNVGASHEMPVAFAETTNEEMENIIQTNIFGTLQLTRAVLPSMIRRSARGGPKSLILNMGSLTGRIPSTLLATYSLSKAGLTTWTKALAEEVVDSRVVVQMVQPAFVTTNMSKIRNSSLFIPTPKTFVRSALSTIGNPVGAQGRKHETTPYGPHALLDYVTGLGGYFSENVAMKVVDKMHRDIRKRALRKKAKLGKAE